MNAVTMVNAHYIVSTVGKIKTGPSPPACWPMIHGQCIHSDLLSLKDALALIKKVGRYDPCVAGALSPAALPFPDDPIP